MNTKTLLGGLIAGVSSFLIGWLVFDILSINYFDANTIQYPGLVKTSPSMLLISIGDLAFGLLLAWVFSIASIKTIAKGFSTGFIFGLLMVLSFDIFMYAEMNLYSVWVIVIDIFVKGVTIGITGAILGWWFGNEAKS